MFTQQHKLLDKVKTLLVNDIKNNHELFLIAGIRQIDLELINHIQNSDDLINTLKIITICDVLNDKLLTFNFDGLNILQDKLLQFQPMSVHPTLGIILNKLNDEYKDFDIGWLYYDLKIYIEELLDNSANQNTIDYLYYILNLSNELCQRNKICTEVKFNMPGYQKMFEPPTLTE